MLGPTPPDPTLVSLAELTAALERRAEIETAPQSDGRTPPQTNTTTQANNATPTNTTAQANNATPTNTTAQANNATPTNTTAQANNATPTNTTAQIDNAPQIGSAQIDTNFHAAEADRPAAAPAPDGGWLRVVSVDPPSGVDQPALVIPKRSLERTPAPAGPSGGSERRPDEASRFGSARSGSSAPPPPANPEPSTTTSFEEFGTMRAAHAVPPLEIRRSQPPPEIELEHDARLSRPTPMTSSAPPPAARRELVVPRGSSGWSSFVAGLVLSFLLVLVLSTLWEQHKSDDESTTHTTSTAPDFERYQIPWQALSPSEASSPATPSPLEPRPKPLPDIEQRPPARGPSKESTLPLKVPARVLSSDGPLPAGAPCEIELHVRGTELDAVNVSCAGQALYDSRIDVDANALSEAELYEIHGRQPGSWAYKLRFSDTQDNANRVNVLLDTFAMEGTVYVDGVDGWSAELRLGGQTLDRKGDSLFGSPPRAFRLSYPLRKRSATGDHPLPLAEPCRLEVSLAMASSVRLMCRAALQCRGRTLYGLAGGGIAPCSVSEGRIVAVSDVATSAVDGSPALTFDASNGRARLRDVWEHRSYDVVFERPY